MEMHSSYIPPRRLQHQAMEPTTVLAPGRGLTQDQLREIIQGPGEEWTYEMRRKCQEILPGLLLGPVQVAKSEETLNELGVTHILCIRGTQEAFSIKPRFEGKYQYLVLDVEDNEEQNLIRLFPQAQAFIDHALAQGGRVLVHCNVGISLSPAFVVMYVMQRLQISWEDALHMVQNRRYCISPNGGFLTQIKEYESIYKASLAMQGAPSNSNSNARRKRNDEDDDEAAARMEDRKRPLVDDDEDVAMQM